jgi:hypothetical protein
LQAHSNGREGQRAVGQVTPMAKYIHKKHADSVAELFFEARAAVDKAICEDRSEIVRQYTDSNSHSVQESQTASVVNSMYKYLNKKPNLR